MRAVLVIVEGRDGAGKDGTIKRLTEHMSPRETRIFAPGKPSDREQAEWYFPALRPAASFLARVVVFNRSWYNRAGRRARDEILPPRKSRYFFDTVADFESLLRPFRTRIAQILSRHQPRGAKEAARRPDKDPLKAWKNSPVDAKALGKWDAYTKARDEMFRRTSHTLGPGASWRATIRSAQGSADLDLLDSFKYPGKEKALVEPDRDIVFPWTPEAEKKGLLAR